jgi:glycosyltransferase involved in cell wall biosynthesis
MKISVCMAAYNGSAYIKNQLASILKQLSDEDEIIIVDDASTDQTVEIIQQWGDPRILLIKNDINKGVLQTFERSLSHAKGEIIFLSDQDDIWLDNKVQKIMSIFQSDKDATLVLSDAEVINGNNEIIAKSYYELRGTFVKGAIPNLIKNKYLGCCLAFRREMLDYFLPLPKDVAMHDMWIGILNDIYGKSIYIEQPLMQYRLHNSNASRGPTNYASLQQMIKWRLMLSKNLVKRLWELH